MERSKSGDCEDSPEVGQQGAGLHSPLEVHTVLHPPGSDEGSTEGEEEGCHIPLHSGASLDGCLDLQQYATRFSNVTKYCCRPLLTQGP